MAARGRGAHRLLRRCTRPHAARGPLLRPRPARRPGPRRARARRAGRRRGARADPARARAIGRRTSRQRRGVGARRFPPPPRTSGRAPRSAARRRGRSHAARPDSGRRRRARRATPDGRARRRVAERARRRAARGRRATVVDPDLDVTGGIKASRVGREDDVGYVVGVALELPLLDQRGAARARAASELVIATAEQRTLRAEVASDLEIARSRFRTSEERARQLVTSAAPRATALIDQARLRWREGESPTFELVDAWRTFVDVKLEVIERLHEARLAELALATAGGAPLDTK
ncbi:MAG: TolC family protein [Deltaproteobacteria bacterium]|nr:TolC family protein [Deltaproteobacteria bacterium]